MYFVTLDMAETKNYPQPGFHETGHSDTILTLALERANR